MHCTLPVRLFCRLVVQERKVQKVRIRRTCLSIDSCAIRGSNGQLFVLKICCCYRQDDAKEFFTSKTIVNDSTSEKQSIKRGYMDLKFDSKNSRSQRCNYRYYFRSEDERSRSGSPDYRKINSLTKVRLHTSKMEWTLMFFLLFT